MYSKIMQISDTLRVNLLLYVEFTLFLDYKKFSTGICVL